MSFSPANTPTVETSTSKGSVSKKRTTTQDLIKDDVKNSNLNKAEVNKIPLDQFIIFILFFMQEVPMNEEASNDAEEVKAAPSGSPIQPPKRRGRPRTKK